MKKLLCLVLTLFLLSLSLTACATKGEKEMLNLFDYTDEETNFVFIEVDDFGFIVVELYPDTAPETVDNFQDLVEDGFYDGLIFHRVIKNFMIQGGDPKGNGTGGSDENVKGEFSSNGFENNLLHKRGVISMARSADPDSASSQFFICHKDASHLDGEYAAFGEVVYGIETVDAIAEVKTNASNNKPYTDVVIKKMGFVTPTENYVPTEKTSFKEPLPFTVSEKTTNYVLLNMGSYGHIVVELYPDVAPETVANFQKLVGEGFYDGLIFHRVIKDFMIQGGDPNGNGTGGSGTNIKGEFSNNGFENNLKHERGVLSMARSGSSKPELDKQYYNSASSQFFICHKDSPHLNGNYAAFGKVIYGMDTVDAIAALETNANNKPLSDVVIKSAQFVTKK